MYNRIIRRKLKERLLKLDNRQLKMFYGILVHYWVKNKYFISDQNFFNLWCELNELCSEVDESFPDPYDDHKLLKSFCQAHPYYFIDILEPGLIINRFCQYLDDRLDILATVADKLSTGDLWASYEYSNKALGLNEDVEELVAQAKEHLKAYEKVGG